MLESLVSRLLTIRRESLSEYMREFFLRRGTVFQPGGTHACRGYNSGSIGMPGDSTNFLAVKGFFIAPLMLALVACSAGNGEGLDQNGQPIPIGPPAEFRLPADPGHGVHADLHAMPHRRQRAAGLATRRGQQLRHAGQRGQQRSAGPDAREPGQPGPELSGAEDPGQRGAGRTHAARPGGVAAGSHRSHPQLGRGRRAAGCGCT